MSRRAYLVGLLLLAWLLGYRTRGELWRSSGLVPPEPASWTPDSWEWTGVDWRKVER